MGTIKKIGVELAELDNSSPNKSSKIHYLHQQRQLLHLLGLPASYSLPPGLRMIITDTRALMNAKAAHTPIAQRNAYTNDF